MAVKFSAAIEQIIVGFPTHGKKCPAPGHALVDAQTLLSVCGGDAVLLRKIVQSLETHCRAPLAEICDAIHRQDGKLLRTSSHKLRGLVGAFSTAAAEAVNTLEQMGGNGQMRGAREQYACVLQIISALSSSLKSLAIPDLMRLAALNQ